MHNKNHFNQNNQKKQGHTPEDFKSTLFKDTYSYLNNIYGENVPLDKVLETLSKFVNDKCKSITTTQIRNIYGKVVPINNVTELKMLRPNLAYIAARQGKPEAKDVITFLDGLIKEVKDENSLESFKKVMETIVAYHKYHHNSK